MKKIPLTQGKFALVDDADFAELSKFKWCAHKHRYTFYARRTVPDKTKESGRKTLHMHRVILNLQKGQICDHIDRNGLDNRRKNLRIASCSLNNLNSKISSRNKSGFKGVSWLKRLGKWIAFISINNKNKYLGLFDTAKEASAAYQKAYNSRMAELTKSI